MKFLRISASFTAIAAAAALAACGGGGGGGNPNPPVSNPGGGPTAKPTNAPTNAPTNSPTNSPTTTPASTPPPIVTSTTTISAYDGPTNGTDGWQTNGATVTGDPADGDTAAGANGSNTFDGIGCALNSESMIQQNNAYHVHAFVGIYVNGKEMAIPDGIGMQNPQDSGTGAINTFSCAYPIHTHFSSGLIHVEDPNLQNSTWLGNGSAPAGTKQIAAPAQYNLKALLDIWGQTTASIGGNVPLTGVYVGTKVGIDPNNNQDIVGNFTANTGSLANILLSHHNAIWLVYGTPPASLPEVEFGIEN